MKYVIVLLLSLIVLASSKASGFYPPPQGVYRMEFDTLNGVSIVALSEVPGSIITPNLAYTVKFNVDRTMELVFQLKTQDATPSTLLGKWKRISGNIISFFVTRALVDTAGLILTPPVTNVTVQESALGIVSFRGSEVKGVFHTSFLNLDIPQIAYPSLFYLPGKSYLSTTFKLKRYDWKEVETLYSSPTFDFPQL